MHAESPFEQILSRVVDCVRKGIDGVHCALQEHDALSPVPAALEWVVSDLLRGLGSFQGIRLRMFLQGKPRILTPSIQHALFLVGREAIINALKHSRATSVEIELQYRWRRLYLVVRDNGCGFDPHALETTNDSYRGLREMRDLAEGVDGQFCVWSRLGAGTEVQIEVEYESGNKMDASAATG